MSIEPSWRDRHLDEDDLRRALAPSDAVHAIRRALQDGLDPADDPPRSVLSLADGQGQLLTMPSHGPGAVGVKLVTVAPDNPAEGLPLIQGLYVVFDPRTLAPLATIDGAALTTLRTPAVSVAALLDPLTSRPGGQRVAVFGAGPQGVGHVHTLAAVGVDIDRVTYVVRNPSRVAPETVGGAEVVAAGESDEVVARADIIVCATSSSTPVFDSRLVRNDVVVMAIGAHEAHTREVDPALMGRAQVIVEDVQTALAECGDAALAIEDGALRRESLTPMAGVVRGEVGCATDRPVVFTGSGMSWEDLVVAKAALAARAG